MLDQINPNCKRQSGSIRSRRDGVPAAWVAQNLRRLDTNNEAEFIEGAISLRDMLDAGGATFSDLADAIADASVRDSLPDEFIGDVGERNLDRRSPFDGILAHNYWRRKPIERLVEDLHQLGPRALAGFLNDLARAEGIGDAIVEWLGRYRRLSPELLRAVGGDRFPRAPMRMVQ